MSTFSVVNVFIYSLEKFFFCPPSPGSYPGGRQVVICLSKGWSYWVHFLLFVTGVPDAVECFSFGSFVLLLLLFFFLWLTAHVRMCPVKPVFPLGWGTYAGPEKTFQTERFAPGGPEKNEIYM